MRNRFLEILRRRNPFSGGIIFYAFDYGFFIYVVLVYKQKKGDECFYAKRTKNYIRHSLHVAGILYDSGAVACSNQWRL